MSKGRLVGIATGPFGCNKCNRTLPLESFRSRGKYYDYTCRECLRVPTPKRDRELATGMRICAVCQAEKPFADYYLNGRKDCHLGKCKSCTGARSAAYMREHPEIYNRAARKWQAAHLTKVVSSRHRFRAQKKGATGSFASYEWEELKLMYGQKCLRCGQREPAISLTVDHVVPLSRGGTNTIDNIQPLCLSCNSRKWQASTDYRTVRAS